MKIGVAQLLLQIKDVEGNYQKINDAAEKLSQQGANLIIFPQMSLVGFPTFDFGLYHDILNQQNNYIQLLANSFSERHLLVGGIKKEEGKLYHVYFHLFAGNIQDVFIKENLIKEDWLNEGKYFARKKQQDNLLIIDNKKLVVNFEDEISDKSFQADLVLHFTALPTHTYFEKRAVINKNFSHIEKKAIVLNVLGSEGHITFPGGSWIESEEASLMEQLPVFEEKLITFDCDNYEENHQDKPVKDMEFIHKSLVFGIQQYFRQSGFQKAVIGLSGGIDSAVVAALALESIGSENVRALLMPSQFSTGHSVTDAEELAKNLGIHYDIIPIRDVFEKYQETLHPIFGDLPFNVAEENIQARIRGNLLMAVANKFNSIVLNTSNKSEALVGYGTLYGDIVGALGVILDLYKTEVYELAEFINRDRRVIPEHIISKPPSAELHPDQKDSDALPEYGLLDEILKVFVDEKKSVDELVEMGYDKETVTNIIRLVYINDYKKYQCPPPLIISGKGKTFPLLFNKAFKD